MTKCIKYLLFGLILLPSMVNAREGLKYRERIYDFGCVGIDFDVYHDFVLYNDSSEPIKIDSVVVTCDCTTVQVPDSTVAAGDSVFIHLKFNTENYYGKISKAIRVYSNDPKMPRLELFYLSTVGQWLYRVQPSPVSLFYLPGKKEKVASFLNPAAESIEVTSIDITHPEFISISKVRAKAGRGGRIELKVVAADGLPAGTYVTNFRVTFDVAGVEDPLLLTVPVKIVRY